jgi:hypothetical protein
MRMRRRFVFGLFCFELILSCFDATATTMEKLSVEKMAELANTVVRAKCVSTSTRWDGGDIWTFTSFEVAETWKGSATSQTTVRLLGGTVGSLTSTVTGVPRFRAGEEVILFLEPTKRGDFTVVSWQQGTFRVVRNLRTGLEIVTQDTAAFETFDPQTRAFKSTGIHNVPLEEFRARVKAAVAESARRK